MDSKVTRHEGSPTLVLLPGLDGTGLVFKPFTDLTPAGIATRVVSFPEDHVTGYTTLESLVLAALPVDRPFVLLGESYSGPLALRVAARRPRGLRAVILCASFIRRPVRGVPRAARALIRPALVRFAPLAALRRLLHARGADAGLRALAREAMKRPIPEVIAARLREVLTLDATDALAACPVPILYLQARRDSLVGPHTLRAMQKIRPEIESAVVDGPHWILQTKPAESWRAIRGFLARREFTT
jgi:pimeloyl-ACP methyl ester carboxylesterase